jgi:hypothetical protein
MEQVFEIESEHIAAEEADDTAGDKEKGAGGAAEGIGAAGAGAGGEVGKGVEGAGGTEERKEQEARMEEGRNEPEERREKEQGAGAGAAVEGAGAVGAGAEEAGGGEHAGGAAVQAFETEEFRYTFPNGHGTWSAKIVVPVNAKRHKPRKKKVKGEVEYLGIFDSRGAAVLAVKTWINAHFKSWSS